MLMCVAPTATLAQTAAKLSSQQLDSLTAPVALYPDALLAQVLMAATFPQDVEAAAAWSKSNAKLQGDAAVKAVASEPWDPSVQSLVAFPQVLATMSAKPDWVAQLGNAFLAQPNDVMDSVQRLRKEAQKAGNLQTNTQQKVVVEQSTIQIVPANPQVVYVPTYNPTVVYGAWPYPAYPPVYVPPPPGYAFASGVAAGIGFGVGVAVTNALWGGFDWNHHDVNINVNHYNNINVNHRIDATTRTTSWNRNTTNVNRNVTNVNRNNANFSNTDRSQRDQYRGRDTSASRDASRDAARQTLQTRTGENLSGSASQRVQDIHQGGAAGSHEFADNHPNARSSASASDLRSNAQAANRNGALHDAGDGDASRRDLQRGQTSRASVSSAHSGGVRNADLPRGGGLRGGESDRRGGLRR
ncbi:DUF3300 domain-containing protein [Trinickia sp. YCB016]